MICGFMMMEKRCKEQSSRALSIECLKTKIGMFWKAVVTPARRSFSEQQINLDGQKMAQLEKAAKAVAQFKSQLFCLILFLETRSNLINLIFKLGIRQ